MPSGPRTRAWGFFFPPLRPDRGSFSAPGVARRAGSARGAAQKLRRSCRAWSLGSSLQVCRRRPRATWSAPRSVAEGASQRSGPPVLSPRPNASRAPRPRAERPRRASSHSPTVSSRKRDAAPREGARPLERRVPDAACAGGCACRPRGAGFDEPSYVRLEAAGFLVEAWRDEV
jgi:hypothetical protein